MTKQALNVLALIRPIHHAIPLNIRYHYSLFFWKCSHFIKQIFNRVYPQVCVLEGQERNSGHLITYAYAGSHTQMQEYWSQIALAAGYKKYSLGRCFFLNVLSYLQKDHPDCNFLLMESNDLTRSFFKKSSFYIPEWVDMDLDISGPMEKLLGNQRSGIQRRIRKFGLTYELTRDPKHFDEFYHNMYLPYMQQRHSGAAAIDTYASLLEIFSRGELILVKNESTLLCAGLFEVQGQQVRCRKMGVQGGNWEYVKEGVIGACYYFLITEMKKRGYKKMHLGGTRPFLSDGVTKFKISLKAEAALNGHNSCVSLTLLKDSAGLQNFLINNPFISFERKHSAHRAVFFQSNDKDNEAFNEMVQSAICYGLGKTDILVFSQEVTERSNYFFSVQPAWKQFDYSTPSIKEKVSLKVSWIKKIMQRFSIAGG